MRRVLILLSLFAVFINSSSAQEVPAPVRAKLVADAAAVKPGESYNLGVLMEIDPGWHVYWKYPGETGLPTRVEFNAPQGFSTGKLNWPIPDAYHKPQGGTDYGYEDSVLLWTSVQVPEDAKLNSNFQIDAKVSWISCKDICIPGKASLKNVTQISTTRKPINTNLYSDWRSALPHAAVDGGIPLNIDVSTSKAGGGRVSVRVTLESKSLPDNIEYYPNPGDSLEVENLKYARDAERNKVGISFDAVARGGAMLSETALDGLIVYTDNNGERSGVELKVGLGDS